MAGSGVDVEVLSGPKPVGTLQTPSEALASVTQHFGSSRIQRLPRHAGRERSTAGGFGATQQRFPPSARGR
jgi:hypothetical protein